MDILNRLGEILSPGKRYERLSRELAETDITPSPVGALPAPRKNYTPPEIKSISGADMVPLAYHNKPLWTDWDTRAAIEEAFKGSSWIFVGIDKLARSVASMPWRAERLVDKDSERWEPVPGHPLDVLIKNPNEYQSQAEFLYRTVASLYVSGNSVNSKVRGLGNVPLELWSVGPIGVKPIPHKEDFIKGYEYEVGGKRDTILAEDAIHIQFPDPANQLWGHAPIMSGARAVDVETEAAKWQQISFKNRCIPDGVMTFERDLTQKQYDDIRKNLRESAQGANRARDILVVGHAAKYNPIGFSAKEMDFIESRNMTREELLAIHGVPPPTVGIYDNATLNNIRTAREILWLDTVLPLANWLASGFNLQLAPEFGDDLRIMYDPTNVEALWEVFTRKLEAAEKLQRMGVPFREINQRLDLGFEDQPWHGEAYIASDLVPVSALTHDEF